MAKKKSVEAQNEVTEEQKNEKKTEKSYTLNEIIPYMVIVLAIGLILGGIAVYHKDHNKDNKALDEFVNTYEEIVDNYYSDIDRDKLLNAGINGMVEYLDDPYASYMDPEASKEFNEEVNGEFVGIGVEIQYDYDKKETTIHSIMEGGPSEGSGLEVGDVIIRVDKTDVSEMTSSQIVKLVRGEANTKVDITVLRKGEQFTYTITRGNVEIMSVKHELIDYKDKKLGYIQVSIFAANTSKQFANALKELEEENMEVLIIDLRNNNGGHLTTVTDMISLFTKKGDPIYQLKLKGKITKVYDETEESRDYKVVILTNQVSASASEVFASTIRDIYGGYIIGKTTFGKGKVQTAYSLTTGAIIKYTTEEWLTAKGESIDGVGVKPDLIVDLKVDKDGYDSQKQAALDYLSE